MTTLNLSKNSIGDAGAQYLADGLKHNETLTTLHLRKNQVGDLGAQYLADALKTNTVSSTLRSSIQRLKIPCLS